jgi:hemerythrin-like domain-containing protein
MPGSDPTSADTPVASFSKCHEGILRHLVALGSLPALLEGTARARRVAAETLAFFRRVVYEHHQEEERELFPAVLASAEAGTERQHVKDLVARLTDEHRRIEHAYERLERGLKDVAKGHDSDLDGAAVEALVAAYAAHAQFEEAEFLPLSQTILGRNGDHMAALGLSLHMRHALPDVLARYGSRI